MSAETSRDVSAIQDEDVLRKMWQETEDFGKKKEIRSHMYKLREQRLKEFYNNGEVSTEIRTSSTTSEGKSRDKPTHADSLADHSFLSLKSKEIRDSESPTRDVSYKITDKHNDQGWQVVTSNETSADGKIHTTKRLATTSGSDKIQGGKIDYAAKNEQLASVYQDGDDKNFTKSVGAQSNTVIKQEAVGGDENSSFKTSSSKTSSSSRVVTEHRSTSGDDYPAALPSNVDQTSRTTTTKVFTDNVPSELKNHPGYVEGKTKVTRETKTLPDGTTVTTTKYETRGGNTSQSTASNKFESKVSSSTQQTSSSKTSQVQSSKTSDQRQIRDNSKAIEYIIDSKPTPECTIQIVRDHNDDVRNQKFTDQFVDTRVNVVRDQSHHSDIKSQQIHSDRRINVVREHRDHVDVKKQNIVDEQRNVEVVHKHYDDQIVANRNKTDESVDRKVQVVRENYDDKDTRNQQIVNEQIERRINVVRDVNNKDIRNEKVVNEQIERNVNVHVTKHITDDVQNRDIRNDRVIVDVVPIDSKDTRTITRTTTTKQEPVTIPSDKDTTRTITTRTTTINQEPVENITQTTTTTTVRKTVQDSRDNNKIDSQFITTERQHEIDTRRTVEETPREPSPGRKAIKPKESSPVRRPVEPSKEQPTKSQPQRPSEQPKPKEQPAYEQPDRRQPIKPGKSELDQPRKPTEGQYETTYRTEFTNKKISVEVSPTHDAFARSLRAVTPERVPSKCSTPTRDSPRNLRSSTSSLRSSTSPEKNRYPSRSPDRQPRDRSTSPKKSTDRFSSSETITYKTRKPSPEKTPTKSPSPQRFVSSDITTKNIKDNVTVTRNTVNTDTLTRNKKVVTNGTTRTDNIDTSTITRRKDKPRSRSPSPTSTVASDIEYIRNVHDVVTDLDDTTNITNTVTTKNLINQLDITQKDSRPTTLEITTKRKVTERSPTSPLTSPRKSPTKDQSPKEVTRRNSLRSPTKEPEKPSRYYSPDERPLKRTDTYEERCRQILGITETNEKRRGSLERSSIKRSSFTKDSVRSPVGDTPRKAIKSPEKSPTKATPSRSPTKEKPSADIPSQVRKSPTKEPLDKKSPTKNTVSEFPSQVRRSPQKEPLEKYPEKKSPTKSAPTVSEFPSQIRKSPQKEPLEPYPERRSPTKEAPKISEFPSQIKKSPEKEPLERYPEKKSPKKEGPQICEFPSQIRRSPERQPLEPYPKKPKPVKKDSDICEFPSQIRRSPEKEPLEPYPERVSPTKEAPKISEFPSQIKKSPEKVPLEPYPEKKSPIKEGPKIAEFPSQIRKSPEKEPLEPYPEKQRPVKEGPGICEFPSQIRRSPEKQPLESYPEKVSPTKQAPQVSEFPSQTRKSPERQPLEPYPEKKSPTKESPKIAEFPSQIRKSPEREPLEPYPEQQRPSKESPQIDEFPSQIRKSPQRQPVEAYPEKKLPEKSKPGVEEFPSQVKKSPQKEPLEPYPEKKSPQKSKPSIEEFPSQTRKSPQKEPKAPYPSKEVPTEKEPYGTYPGRVPTTDSPRNKSPEKLRPQSTVKKPKKPKDHNTESSTEEDSDIEETITETEISYLNAVPVDEPLVTKKFISALCREDEVERTDLTKKTTQELIEKEILENEVTRSKTVKKDQPKSDRPRKPETAEFIETERNTTTVTTTKNKKDIPREKSPIKKPVTDSPVEKKPSSRVTTTITKTIKKGTPKTPTKKQEIHRVEKTKFIGQTEYTDEYSKPRPKPSPTRKPQKPSERITLQDIENMYDQTEDTKVHIRTHRIDDTVNRKTVTANVIMNGDITRKTKPKDSPKYPATISRSPVAPKSTVPSYTSPSRRLTSTKPEETKPKTVTQSRYITTAKKDINVDQTTKVRTIRPTVTTSTTTIRKVVNITGQTSKPKYTKPEEVVPKKHVVTTTITVTPKARPITSKPSTKTVTTKTTTTRTSKLSQPKSKSPKREPLQNGHVCSDTEEESVVDSLEDLTVETTRNERFLETTDTKITRTATDKTTRKTPVRGYSPTKTPTEVAVGKPSKKIEKCITTKTVIINNKGVDEREVIVDLQRSKSSREPTPDRLCPVPLSSDEESGIPRYPDQVVEPEDGSLRRKPKKLSDIPIMESEDTTEFTRITEVKDVKKITEVDKVEETDESLLSVNKKISKFLDTADKLTKEPLRPTGPAPKVTRPNLQVTDDLEEDECLLSVSDKVNKFITTAEKLIIPQQLPDRPKSPKCQMYPDDGSDTEQTRHVSEKVSHFTNTSRQVPQPKKPAQVPRRDVDEIDERIREDDCLLSVSQKVSKFISTADKLTSSELKKPVSLAKIDIKPKEEPVRKSPERRLPERQSPERKSPTRFVPSECVQIETEEQTYTRKPSYSPDRYSPTRRSQSPKQEDKTPPRRPSNQYSTINKSETIETKYSRRDSSPKYGDITPKSARRPSQEEPKPVLSPTGRLRSTETIKKAKALFENISKERETTRQRDIISRPSVFEGRRLQTPDDRNVRPSPKDTAPRKRLSYSEEEEEEKTTKTTHRTSTTVSRDDSLKSTKLVLEKIRTSVSPGKDRSRSKSPETVTYRPRERSMTPDHGDVPHYMLPLDRSLRPNSPHRENLGRPITPTTHPVQPNERDEPKTTKFGVTLKRTDSGRAITSTSVTTTSTDRRKSSITLEKRVTEEEVEEIFDLEVLEELLEKVVGYDLRRKIRAQIRLVKKLISENKLSTYITKKTTTIRSREPSPTKGKSQDAAPKRVTEYQSKFTKKGSPDRKVVDNKLYQHTDLTNRQEEVRSSTEYQSSYSYSERRTSSEYASRTTTRRSQSPEVKPVRAKSPEKPSKLRSSPEKTTSTTKTTDTKKTFTQLKKTTPVSKPVDHDDKPEWVRQRNLRKTNETSVPASKRTSTTTTTTTRRETQRTSPTKEVKPTDLITSSYGVGPTDENGAPLFGLKALRAQNKTSTTKVQGTVIKSEYYSENGGEPVGQVSVTKYSTDPRDIGADDEINNSNKGITSVTTTQKFGYKDTPSLRTLTNKKKEITSTDDSTTTSKTSKVTRKNSVKALSQKFIENAVETLKSERQTTYPKAGLILRTSSFKDSGSGTDDSRETSPANRECDGSVTVRTSTTTKTTTGGDTFLTNRNRVSGVKDVISRMKTEDHREGDTEEDAEARGLLNKFIGSQVILTGMEARSSTTKTTTAPSPTSTVRRSTKITTTVTEGGKPITKTRVFQRPITEEELETVWDEQTLRLLLEQSTDYDERRVIRARLRQLMAEQEACADLVDKASQEQSGGQIEGESLLLPLLQGLLEAPENEQPADSGTESGEDQRTGLIAEVQNALDKLSASLRSDATDITPERRCSLLQLVTKLQAGLSTTTPKLERRQSSGPGRFGRRKQRQNRHTVGVSSEELADARRLMEEISLKDITPSQSQTKVTVLQKQNSESSVTSNSSSFNKFGNKVPVKNATAKPFSSSNSNISNTSSSVQTPDPVESGFELLFNEDPNAPKENKPVYGVTKTSSKGSVEKEPIKSAPLSQNASSEEVSLKSVHKAVQQAAARKKGTSESAQDSETEDDTSTVTAPKEASHETPPPSPLIENPIYSHPAETVEPQQSYEEKCRRFNTPSKKLKMKRANTVDIPNSMNVYEDDDEDSETEDEAQQRKNNYYALRGPIRVGDPARRSTMPVLEPKTESDQKFLAFINKNNQNSGQAGSMWSGESKKTAGTVWGNKFGNIKNTFEKAASNNSARNFWKTADDAVTSGSTPYGPKISRRSARNLQQMFEEKQRQSEERYQNENQGVVTGSLTLKTQPDKNYKLVPQPLPVNMFSHAPQSAFKPIQKKAPQKPETLPIVSDQEILKTEIKESKNDPPMYLYSPKPLLNSQTSSTTSSPVVTSKPWVTNGIDHGGRVLSMAAKKFEVPPPQENHFVKPRKLSKDYNKTFSSQPPTPEKMTAPYLVKSADQKSNTVRKLSGQYDNLGNKPVEYSSQSTVRYQQPPSQEKPHYVPNYSVPQHMTQTYKPTQNSYQGNTYNQFNSNVQKQPQYTKPFIPQPPQTYQTQVKATAQQFTPPQHYTTPTQQFTPPQTQYNTQSYATQHKPHVENFQPVNYSIRYDQQPQSNTRPFQTHNPPQDFKPVNYSITYDKPQLTQPQPKPQETPNYTIKATVQQVYQHVPGQEVEPEQEYTSTCQFTPQSSPQPHLQPVAQPKPHIQTSPVQAHPPKLETQMSNESVCEYTAISSKVMTGPVSQQAVTVRQKSPMSRSEHDMEAAFNLRNSLQKVQVKTDTSVTSKSPTDGSFTYKQSEPKAPASPNNSFKYKPSEQPVSPNNSFKVKPLSPVRYNPEAQNKPADNYPKYNPSEVPKPTVRPSSFKFKPPEQFQQKNENKTYGVVKPMQQKPPGTTPIYNNVTGKVRESLEINEKGQSVVTSKFNIPVINVKKASAPNTPTVAQVLSKSDSWHQICMASQTQQNGKPSPSTSPTGRPVMRSKSSHTLAVPQKQFEAGMSREELVQKRRTMEAYFSGQKSPQPSDSTKTESKVVRRSINRIKTSEKMSAYRQPSGLCRSRTLPDIVCPDMLDESNPDQAFDDLFKSSS